MITSCSSNDPFSFTNWYDLSTYTNVSIDGNIDGTVKAQTDNEINFNNTNFFLKDDKDKNLYFSGELINVMKYEDMFNEIFYELHGGNYRINLFDYLYFINNNYFYILEIENRYEFYPAITRFYFKDEGIDCVLPLPILKSEYRISEKNQSLENNEIINNLKENLFVNYTFNDMYNFYSKFTNYVNIDVDNETIEVIADKIKGIGGDDYPRISLSGKVNMKLDYRNNTVSFSCVYNDNYVTSFTL